MKTAFWTIYHYEENQDYAVSYTDAVAHQLDDKSLLHFF